MTIRVLLADDHEIVREGFRVLIEREPDLEVIAEASDGKAAVEMARELKPDVVVMDVSMPELSGIEATRQILADCPRAKVIALSVHSEVRYVGEMLQAGATAYLLKNCAFQELSQAIHAAYRDEAYLSPKIARCVIDGYVRTDAPDPSASASILSAREREVLQHLVEGKTSKQIAAELDVTVRTIDAHRQNVMEKLRIHSVAELTKFALREGLTSLE